VVVNKLRALEKEHGPHFAPPELLLKHAKDGTRFVGNAPVEA